MHQFEFHYQYQPADLKAIREANSEPVFSPASNITAASIGFALTLMILGAMGAWIVLVFALITGFVAVMYFAKRLNSQSRGNREYQFRKLQLFDKYLVEISENCESRKSWDVFEAFNETSQHFLLRHYQRIIAIPKRVMQQTEIERCRDFMAERVGARNCGPIEKFEQWFGQSGLTIYRFTWQNHDAASIRAGDLTRFNPGQVKRADRSDSVVGYFAIAIILGFVVAVYFQFVGRNNGFMTVRWPEVAVSSLISLIALSLPFVAIRFWQRYIKMRMQNQEIRIPREEISIFQTDEFVCVGYEGAVSRYEVTGITALYLGPRLIGFRVGFGPVNVIPIRAFGDITTAREFLSRMNISSQLANSSDSSAKVAVETGNPYQPPGC